MQRDVAFKALVGSHNYNLHTQQSDRDYKVFVLPTFSDLYHADHIKKSTTSDDVDLEFHDIRKIVSLFWKSNVNFVETLFSTEIIVYREESYYSSIQPYIEELFSMKVDIARMNIPYLYKACIGMYISKQKQYERDLVLSQTNGVIQKHKMTIYRILDFLERFYQTDFTDFKAAMSYSNQERACLLELKKGNEIDGFITKKKDRVNELEGIYTKQLPREDTKQKLEQIIYELVYSYFRKIIKAE